MMLGLVLESGSVKPLEASFDPFLIAADADPTFIFILNGYIYSASIVLV